jgi:hypothetical protein
VIRDRWRVSVTSLRIIIFCHFVQVASSTKGMTLVINRNVGVEPIYIARSCVQVGATSPRTRRRKQPKTNTQPSHTHLIPLIIKLSIVCVCLPFWPTPFRVSWLHFSAQSADEYIEDQIKQSSATNPEIFWRVLIRLHHLLVGIHLYVYMHT